MYLRIASSNGAGHELMPIVETHSATLNGSCDVTVINPHTNRRNRVQSWTSNIVPAPGDFEAAFERYRALGHDYGTAAELARVSERTAR